MNALRPLFVAALFFSAVPALAETPPVPQPTQQQATTRPRVDVAFVLDTTGSMGGLLEGAKQKIWSLASQMARGKPAPILRVGVVAYRDQGDAYVAQRFDLTRDLDAVYAHLRTLNADGGGDTPEHVGRGLGEAVKNLTWSAEPNTMRLIFVVGDAPPQHYHDGWEPETWAQRAKKQGIIVNTIRCGGDPSTEAAFVKLAQLGDGNYASIDGSGGVVAVATPYDDKLTALNAAIVNKTVYVGTAPARKEAEMRAKGVADLGGAAAADRLSYAAASEKGGYGKGAFAPAATTGAIDVVASPAAAATAPTDSLPPPMKPMSPAERVKYAEELSRDRSKLEADATKVANDREAWIQKNVATKRDSFDAQVMEQVRRQGAKHGIAY